MSQITINLSPEQLGKFSENIIGVFNELSVDEKKDIAKQVMQSWLNDPVKIEESARERDIIWSMRNQSYYRDKSDSEIKNSWEFKDNVRKYKTSKETMVIAIVDEVKNHYKNVATELAKNDPQFAELMTKVSDDLRIQLPDIVRKAMTDFMMNNMSMWQNGMWEHVNHYHQNNQNN